MSAGGAAFAVETRRSGRPEPSADLLCELDDDPLRAADVAEPRAVSVALGNAPQYCLASGGLGWPESFAPLNLFQPVADTITMQMDLDVEVPAGGDRHSRR